MLNEDSFTHQESLLLAKEAQRLSLLKSVPDISFIVLVSFLAGLSFGFMCAQQGFFAVSATVLFPIVVLFYKWKNGLWPLGYAPFVRGVNDLNYKKGLWKTMKANVVMQVLASITLMFVLVSYVGILELRDDGYWWITIASGISVWGAMFTILLNSRSYYLKKYSGENNE